jgi:N-acetyl-alpha-D-muramate 1-phosphate uridylyltransferase
MAKFPTVLILAGGLGTRVRDLNPNLSKAMLPICGKPFIAHQLRLLARESVDEVILCVGYQSQSLIDFVGSGKAFGINVRYSFDGEQLLGTGGAVRQAQELYKLETPLAVIYGDSYLDTSFAPIYASFLQCSKLGLLTVYENDNRWIESNILYKSGLIVDYSKNKAGVGMKHVDYGLSIFQPQAFCEFSINKKFDLSEVFLTLLKEHQLASYEVKDRFYEAGSSDGIKELTEHLMRKQ